MRKSDMEAKQRPQKTILHLTLTKKWFDMILSGEKKEEYREIKGFWSKRLTTNPLRLYVLGIGWTPYTIHRDAEDVYKFLGMGTSPHVHYIRRSIQNIIEQAAWQPFDYVQFRNGYAADARKILVECKGIKVGTPKPEWSDGGTNEVFVIKLGNVVVTQSKGLGGEL